MGILCTSHVASVGLRGNGAAEQIFPGAYESRRIFLCEELVTRVALPRREASPEHLEGRNVLRESLMMTLLNRDS
jgi:hypothetical protein